MAYKQKSDKTRAARKPKAGKTIYGIIGMGRFGLALAQELHAADADLIIVDEFGYPLMENHPSYAALFYAFISSRYEKKSTIITTNRSVTDWPRYLGNDKDCCGAILDRFLHHSIRVCFKGQSYRQRHMRQERLSANPDKATFAKKMTTE